jgi:hypothetical protein
MDKFFIQNAFKTLDEIEEEINKDKLNENINKTLEEKLPRDLAKAYRNTSPLLKYKYYGHNHFPSSMSRRNVSIDFEKSNYRELSKEEALKYSKKGDRCNLRVILKSNYGDHYIVAMWDEDNNLMINLNELKYCMKSPLSITSFKDIIKASYKIYLTDENDSSNKIDRSKLIRKNTEEEQELLDLSNKVTNLRSGEINGLKLKLSDKDKVMLAADIKQSINTPDEKDTGDHSISGAYYNPKNILRRAQKEYEIVLNKYGKDREDPAVRNALYNLKLKQTYAWEIKKDALKKVGQHRSQSDYREKSLINNLSKFILLKFLANIEAEKFEKIENLESNYVYYDSEIYENSYYNLKLKLDELNKRAKEIAEDIQKIKQEITPAKQKQFEDLVNNKLDKIASNYEEYIDKLNDLRKEKGLPVKESLNTENKCYYRIYTKDNNDNENFIDDYTDLSEKEALNKVKELSRDTNLKQICLVKVNICSDNDDVEIIYDSLDECLNLKGEVKEKSKGERIAEIIANCLASQCGPYRGEDPKVRENEITLYSQSAPETYRFNDDGSVDFINIEEAVQSWIDHNMIEEDDRDYMISEYKHSNSVKDFLNQHLSWSCTIENIDKVLSNIESILSPEYLDKNYSILESAPAEKIKKPTIGELVDSIIDKEKIKEEVEIKKESEKLTEGKSFDLKDENQVIDALAYKGIDSKQDDSLVVIDPSVESIDDDYKPREGDAILECRNCKAAIFIETDKVKKEENSGDTEEAVYNIDMPCPHCGAKNGFKYQYQAASKDSSEVQDKIKSTEEEENKKQPEDTEIITDEDTDIELPAVDKDFVELDKVDNVKEESFEKLINPYLTKLYENVESFKVESVDQISRNDFKITGKIKGTNDNEHLVEFLFKKVSNKNKELIFEGYSELFTDNKKAYKLTAKVDNNELLFENFEYKYNKNIDGEDILIEGIEK